jgi:acyl-CoA thioester hydrolase
MKGSFVLVLYSHFSLRQNRVEFIDTNCGTLGRMSNSPVFSYNFIIPENVIDENGHANNVAYVQWMQDAAIRHANALTEYTPPENTTWYAREHRIEYLLPAFLGEEIEVRTWLSELRRVRAHRRYEFIRKSDGKLIAKGETDWVYVESTTGRPIAIPAEAAALFPILPDSIK